MKKELFIQKAIFKHGYLFNYDLVPENIKKDIKIPIQCSIHGIFNIRYDAHLSGQKCGKCGDSVLSNYDEFVEKANKKHKNKYIYPFFEYHNCKEKVEIICPIHGPFFQTPDSHIAGHGCVTCSTELNANLKKEKARNTFADKANKIHNNKYNYSEVDYITAIINVKIICPKHGHFYQSPNTHLSKSGCPRCHTSLGEIEVEKYLIEHNIKYLTQHSFPDCKYISILFFDFYLPDLGICIEYDGRQHYIPYEIFGGEEGLRLRQKRDAIKSLYCSDNSIPLLRIRYDEDVKEILEKFYYLEISFLSTL